MKKAASKYILINGNRSLLDTSVIVHAFKRNNTISARLDAMAEVYVPVTAIGELFYGAFRSADPNKHVIQIQSFLLNCKVLFADTMTAEIYGNIKSMLVKKGKLIPENDIWIAAIAYAYNLSFFTTDNHFKEIDGISLI